MSYFMTMNKANEISTLIPDYLPRLVDLQTLLKGKPWFLFGPRQTGEG